MINFEEELKKYELEVEINDLIEEMENKEGLEKILKNIKKDK